MAFKVDFKTVRSALAILLIGMQLTGCLDIQTQNNETMEITSMNKNKKGSALPLEDDYSKKYYFGIMDNKLQVIKEALEDGADINNANDHHPIMLAFEKQEYEIVKYLIEAGADPNWVSSNNISILMDSTRRGRPDICELLIEKGADVNFVGFNGYTPLDLHLREGSNLEIISVLIEKGADVTQKSLKAAMNSVYNYNIVKLITEKLIESGQETGLDKALEAAYTVNSDALSTLIDEKKISEKNAEDVLLFTSAFGEPEVMDKLLGQNPAPKIYPTYLENGRLISTASKYGNLNMVQHLFNIMQNTEDMPSKLKNALETPIRENQAEIVEFFLSKGIKPDGEKNEWFVVYAAENGSIEVIKLLEKYGYDFTPDNMYRAMLGAARNNHIDVIQYFMDAGIGLNDSVTSEHILDLCGSYDMDTIKFLVENGANINGDQDGGSPLFFASQDGKVSVVEYLLQNDADVNAAMAGSSRQSIMSIAINRGQMAIVKLLGDGGASLEYTTEGKTYSVILDAAISREMLAYCIEKGTDVNFQHPVTGTTALMTAASVGNIKGVEMLIEKGADISLKNKKGENALDLAQVGNNQKIIALLNQN